MVRPDRFLLTFIQKYVFQREHRHLQSRNKQTKKHKDKQARYMLKGQYKLEEKGWFESGLNTALEAIFNKGSS